MEWSRRRLIALNAVAASRQIPSQEWLCSALLKMRSSALYPRVPGRPIKASAPMRKKCVEPRGADGETEVARGIGNVQDADFQNAKN